ncbi:hypothetical protein C8Q80DRAFT_1266029 [Daedaleopsis nitida]|nr:hypothetical protein C8Q80DRAFT_1266029 [Daedaleopsis nitida]
MPSAQFPVSIAQSLRFLYPHEPDRWGAAKAKFDLSFFLMPNGSDVPPKYPDITPAPTIFDIMICFLQKKRKMLSILALVSREWCHAVRKHRFHHLGLRPGMNCPRLLQVFRPDTVIPHVRHLHINGCLNDPGMISPEGLADHRWLNSLLPLIESLSIHAHIDFLFLESLGWGDLSVELRANLREFTQVRALSIVDVDFWNSNQYLMTLNAYPRLQYLQTYHTNYHALTHVPAQLARKEPLLLTELVIGCAYTNILMEWLLAQRPVLAVEELTVHSRDMYRDDCRLARVVRMVSPWLKRFSYSDWADSVLCEGAVAGTEETDRMDDGEYWVAPRVDAEDVDDILQGMDVDDEVQPEEDLVDDPNGTANTVPLANEGAHAKPARARELNIAKDNLVLPDDEEGNRVEDMNSEFYSPSFSSDADRGYPAFAAELSRRIDTPMLEAVEGSIRWTSEFSLLTLKMLCLMGFENQAFYRFDLAIAFEDVALFNNAPWKAIDGLLAHASERMSDELEEDGPDCSLTISVRGWNLQGRARQVRLRDVKKNLPQALRARKLRFSVQRWVNAASPPDPGSH